MLVCEQLELYNMKHRAAVLCHMMKNQEKSWPEEKRRKSGASGASQYRPIQTPGSILPLGSTIYSWSLTTKQNYFWLEQIFPVTHYRRVLTNTNTKQLVILKLPYPKVWSRTLNSELVRGHRKGAASLLPLLFKSWNMQLHRRSGSLTPLILTVSARNDG